MIEMLNNQIFLENRKKNKNGCDTKHHKLYFLLKNKKGFCLNTKKFCFFKRHKFRKAAYLEEWEKLIYYTLKTIYRCEMKCPRRKA